MFRRHNYIISSTIKYTLILPVFTLILISCTQSPAPIDDLSDDPTKTIPNYRYERPDIKEIKSDRVADEDKNSDSANKIKNERGYDESLKGSYKANSYQVKSGDTLFYIAWISGNNVDTLAKINNLSYPYSLKLGQIIQLSPNKNVQNNNSKPKTNVVKNNSNAYVVKKGDTLYSISREVGIDVLSLISYNKLNQPNNLRLGQILKLPSSKVAPEDISFESANKTAETKNTISTTQKSSATSAKITTNKNKKGINWQWPAKGSFEKVKNGIDIKGKVGDKVVAASDGKVLYLNNNVPGYGNLIIIKHNDDYLTAYANNKNFLVKEHENVKAGQQIATMGKNSDNEPNLHFEIRYRTDSVNPLDLLPKK